MREIDSEYIANQISSLTRIPIRVYIDNELVNYSDSTHFPKDPAAPFLDSFMAIGQAVSYYITRRPPRKGCQDISAADKKYFYLLRDLGFEGCHSRRTSHGGSALTQRPLYTAL